VQTFFDAGLRVWIGDEINGFFVVVGWTDPAGSRSHIGALLLGYYTEDGRLHHAGRAGTGMTTKEIKRLAEVLAPRQVARAPGAAPPPSRDRPGLSPFLNEIGQNAGLSQPAASEEAAFCCSTGTAFRSGRAEHRKQ
jgi:hypothetical protein